jgi:hypothetical protein
MPAQLRLMRWHWLNRKVLRMRPLYKIADEIIGDMAKQSQKLPWRQKFAYAWPYLKAMRSLHDVQDNYGCDSGKSVVLYFLANAGTWRGDVARRVKAELKGMVK